MATKNRLLALEQRCLFVERSLQSILARLDNKPAVTLFLSPEDKVRLLNLHVWSLRYSVPLDYIVQVLLKRLFAKHRRPNRSLGIRVSSLTGNSAELFVAEQAQKDFPNQEMKTAAKEQKKRTLANVTSLQLTGIDPSKYEEQWRQRQQALKRSSRLLQRPWRDNPWL
jgi:hypothetical protein